MPLIHSRLELILSLCSDGFFFQAHSDVAYDSDILRISLSIDDQLDRNTTLKLGFECSIGKFRLYGVDQLPSCDAAAYAHNASTVPANATRSDTGTMACSNTTAVPLAKPCSTATAC